MLHANTIRVLLASAAVALVPAVAQAQLCSSCLGGQTTTTYMPYQQTSLMPVTSGVSGCNTCYMPETKMKWTYSRIERTNYKPVTLIDPCSGCQQTAYQPVTTKSLLPWLHRVPVTTYRPASYAATCATSCPTTCAPSQSSCGPCGGTSYGYDSGTCSSCVGGSAASSDPGYPPVGQTYRDPADSTQSRMSQMPTEDPESDKTNENESPPVPSVPLSSPNANGVSLPQPPSPVHKTVSWLSSPSEGALIPLRPAAPGYVRPIAPAAPAEKVEFGGWTSIGE